MFSQKLLITPSGVFRQINELKKRNVLLSLENKNVQYIVDENKKLRTILNFKKQRNAKIIVSEVISFDPSNWRRIIYVNAGKKDGIVDGLYAVNEEGWLIGIILEANNDYSRLLLINDPSFELPVFVGNSSCGLLQGGLEGAKLLYIENYEDVKTNDLLWIKQPHLAFPIYIGKIKNIKKDKNNLFSDIEVTLFTKTSLPTSIFILR